MAFELSISAPFHFSARASSKYLSMDWGRAERGFVLESGAGANPSGKIVETWRSPGCNSLNVSAFGLLLVVSLHEMVTPASAVV